MDLTCKKKHLKYCVKKTVVYLLGIYIRECTAFCFCCCCCFFFLFLYWWCVWAHCRSMLYFFSNFYLFFFFCMAQPLTSTRVHRFWLDVLFLLPVVCKLFNLQCDQLVLDFSFLVSFGLGFFPAKAKQNFKKRPFFCWCCYCSCWLNMSFYRKL